MSEIKTETLRQYLERRIRELTEADALFCKDRWDMSKPEFERKMAREWSNEATARRHELEDVLKRLPPTAEAKQAPTTHYCWEKNAGAGYCNEQCEGCRKIASQT